MRTCILISLAASFIIFSSCQKDTVNPVPDINSLTSKATCGDISEGELVCKLTSDRSGTARVGNSDNAIYLEVKASAEYSRAWIIVKPQFADYTSDQVHTYNYVHADPLNNKMYVLPNTFRRGESVMIIARLTNAAGEEVSITAPFLLHTIQACSR